MIIAPYIEMKPEISDQPVVAGSAWTVAEIVDLVSQGMKARDIRKHLHVKRRTVLSDEAIAAAVSFSRDSYCTPQHVADLLPFHDWDPCSNPRSHVRAHNTCMLERGENGLEVDWFGVFFCNGPFSNLMPFVEKLRASPLVTAAAFLVNVDNSTRWWKELTDQLDSIFFFDSRLKFEPPPGITTTTNNKPQALIAHRAYFEICAPGLFELGAIYERRAA